MSDQLPSAHPGTTPDLDPLPRLVQALVDQVADARAVWERVERQAIPLLERIALALEHGSLGAVAGGSDSRDAPVDRGAVAEFRSALADGRWDQAEAILVNLTRLPDQAELVATLTIERDLGRDRALATWTERIEAARVANDAAGALDARDQIAAILPMEDLRVIDRAMIGWLMKLIQRRLRIIPIGTDLALLVARVADRFGATPEGASLRAALPTLRRSAGLCPRCAEPYLGVDDACPKCLAQAGQEPSLAPTLTFVSAEDDLDDVASDRIPLDLNKVETWQFP